MQPPPVPAPRGVPGYLSWAGGFFMNRPIAAARQPLPAAHDAPGLAARDAELSVPDWGMDASAASRLFAAEWGAAVKAGGGKASLPRVLWRAFRGQFLLAAGLKLAWGVLVLTGVTYFVRTLLAYIRFRASDPVHTPEEASVGILHAIGFLLCTLLQSWAMQQMSIVSTRLGLRVESAVSAALYSKALRYDRFAQGPVDLVGLATKDCAKLREACTNLQFLWSGALEAVAIMVILLVLVGRAALPGLGVVLLLVPLQFAVGMATASARSSAIAAADTRVRLTDEVLRSIKLVKMYAYEDKFAAGVAGERRHEDAIAAWGGLLKAINYALVFAMPPIIALSIFGVHAQESGLEAGLAFTTLSLFNTLRLPLVLLPKGLRAAVEASSASARITDFLLAPEREGTPVAVAAGKAAPEAEAVVQVVVGEEGGLAAAKQPPSPPLPTGSIHMQAASFAYGSGQPLLQGLTLRLAPGSLTAITGTVGSGKSNLLAAVLGHMGTVAGSCSTAGSYAYVPQTSWCAHGTVRDNILFGRPWDEARYRSTLFACALETDCGLLAEGDLTEIGERGMNLSGGQRQRIAIARAVYARADIVLLDSPLSAVDSYTSQHIFTHAITGMLRAEGATVLLVTHQLELLPAADTLVVMREGRAAYAGAPTPAALRAHFPQREGGEAQQHVDEGLLSALGGAPEGAEGEPAPARAPLTPRSRSSTAGASSSSEAAEAARASPFSPRSRSGTLGAAAASSSSEAEALQRKALSVRAATLSSPGAVTLRSLAHATTELPLALPGSPEYAALSAKRMAERITAGRGAEGAGAGRSSAYLVLLWELRVWVFLGLLGVFVTTQLVRIYSDIWVSVWVTKPFAGRGEEWYLAVYGGYVAAFCVMLLLRGWTFYSSFVAAVTRLHDKMFAALMRAPMSFFTLTPLGSVLSVVSLDMDRITEYLLEDVYMVMVYVMILGTTIGVVVSQVNVYAAVAAGLLALAVAVYVRYLAAASVLKGRAGAASTAVAAHLSETMQGIAVVQAFQAEARYTEHFQAKLHAAQGAQFTLACLNLWLTVRQDVLGCLMVFGTCIMCVALEVRLSPAAAGLAVSNSFQILLFLSLMVRTAAAVHDAMSSVDRLHALAAVAPEPDLPPAAAPRLADSWPTAGDVEFQSVVMSYLPSAPHVLKGVSFRCQPGEKVGIVGRTGAGKSSLIMAMFRLAQPDSGAVRIDGVDVSKLALKDLRQRLAIIPQEPVMFEGSLRSNLDPFGERSDAQLLEALARCLLADMVAAHPLGLLQPVASSGANYSLGQQQLVCLARAFLNKSRVLLLDEATAALDSETDALVQRVVRSAFADRTVLTIAHRLDTVIDADRILVMDAGRVAEFASPSELLRDEGSIFASLCRQAGAGAFASLKATADRHQEVLLRLQEEVRAAQEGRALSRRDLLAARA